MLRRRGLPGSSVRLGTEEIATSFVRPRVLFRRRSSRFELVQSLPLAFAYSSISFFLYLFIGTTSVSFTF